MTDQAECEVCNGAAEIVVENLHGSTMVLCLNCTAMALSEHPRLMALAVAMLLLSHGAVELEH
jgi:hypothetical protein